MTMPKLASRYTGGIDDRHPYLDRAYSTAELCIPSLLIRNSEDCNTVNRLNLPTPYQSAGARGINVMSSKMSMGMFPPGIPFARHAMDMVTERTIDKAELAEWRRGLADIDSTIYSYFEAMGIRPHLDECFKQLLNSGNVLLILDPEGGSRVIKMTNYMVERSPKGDVETITIKEHIRPISLPPEVRQKIQEEHGEEALNHNKPVPIYTGVEWNPETQRYDVWQECLEMEVGERGEYTKDNMPFLALWLLPIHGENWGYGFMASYLGDLISLEGLSEALVKASAAAAKVVFALAEEADVDEDEVANAENLSVIRLNPEHLKAIQLDKRIDLVTVREAVNDLRAGIARATLENSSIQRNNDRVTREEILMMAEELEVVLVGGYAQLGQSLQRALVNWIKHQKKGSFQLPPEDLVQVSIVTGMEALGRSAELQRLDSFIGGAMNFLGADFIARRLNGEDYMTRRAAALGFNSDGLVLSEDEVRQSEQQEQAAQLLGQMAPQLLQQLGGAAQQAPPEETS